MILRRFVLSLLAFGLLGGALYLASIDIVTRNHNCGSAILTRDPSEVGAQINNVSDEAFAVESIQSSCSHEVWGRRFLVGVMVVGAGGAMFVSSRLRKVERVHFAGDPIV